MRFDLEAKGVPRARRRFARLGERAERNKPLLEDVVDVLLAGERRQWRSRSGWEPLAASTRARKRRQHLPPRVLEASGTLHRALTVRGAPGQLVTFRRDEVRFGIKGGRSDAYYGRFHQKGRGVPKRVIVPKPTAQTRRALTKATKRHLTS